VLRASLDNLVDHSKEEVGVVEPTLDIRKVTPVRAL
jgi:hypothetical protein